MIETSDPSRFVSALRAVEFGWYAVTAMAIHALIALPALVARTITDIGLGLSIFEIVKPKKRVDLVYRRTADNSSKPTR